MESGNKKVKFKRELMKFTVFLDVTRHSQKQLLNTAEGCQAFSFNIEEEAKQVTSRKSVGSTANHMYTVDSDTGL
jgi:hypothetical protein